MTGTTVLVAVFALLASNDATGNQQDLARQGQITDRFTKAIDQLGQEGTDKLAIRLGGIYALERIMRDSTDDERNVVEVLCAFIREHTRIAPQPSPAPSPAPAVRAPTTDVQAALTVLGRRANVDKPGFGSVPEFGIVDLRGAHLVGVDLTAADLIGAHLGGADLVGADLAGAHLGDADLTGADLTGARLFAARLRDARLTGAHLGSADLGSADLTGVDLTRADLTRADLSDARLGGAQLGGADLAGAHLGDADLTRANLSHADLSHADLSHARLIGASLLGASLTGADLTGADLTGAYLIGAHLGGADLTPAIGLKTENLECAVIDEKTKLPPGVSVPADRSQC